MRETGEPEWMKWVRDIGEQDSLIKYATEHPDELDDIQKAMLRQYGDKKAMLRQYGDIYDEAFGNGSAIIAHVLDTYNPIECRACCLYLICRGIYE